MIGCLWLVLLCSILILFLSFEAMVSIMGIVLSKREIDKTGKLFSVNIAFCCCLCFGDDIGIWFLFCESIFGTISFSYILIVSPPVVYLTIGGLILYKTFYTILKTIIIDYINYILHFNLRISLVTLEHNIVFRNVTSIFTRIIFI